MIEFGRLSFQRRRDEKPNQTFHRIAYAPGELLVETTRSASSQRGALTSSAHGRAALRASQPCAGTGHRAVRGQVRARHGAGQRPTLCELNMKLLLMVIGLLEGCLFLPLFYRLHLMTFPNDWTSYKNLWKVLLSTALCCCAVGVLWVWPVFVFDRDSFWKLIIGSYRIDAYGLSWVLGILAWRVSRMLKGTGRRNNA